MGTRVGAAQVGHMNASVAIWVSYKGNTTDVGLNRTFAAPQHLVLKYLATDRSHLKFGVDPARQSHKPPLRWRYCGVCLAGSEIKHVYDRASDVFLP
jgi:hypothetical protein